MDDLPQRKVVSLWWVTYPGKMVSLWWVTYPGGKNDGLIVMGDLPRKMMKGGLIVTGDLPKDRMWLTWQKDLAGEVLTG